MSIAASSAIVRTILFVAGFAGASIGGLMLTMPVEFHGTAGIMLGEDISLMNELRATGGGVLVTGLFVMAGAFRTALAFASAAVATLVYLANGFGRLYSMSLDGPPSDVLVAVASAEIAMGLVCAYALKRASR
jgi:hypothetical protein